MENQPSVDASAVINGANIVQLASSDVRTRRSGAGNILSENHVQHIEAGDAELAPGLTYDQIYMIERELDSRNSHETTGRLNKITRRALVDIGHAALERSVPDLVTAANILESLDRPGIRFKISRYLLKQLYDQARDEAFAGIDSLPGPSS